MLKLTVLAAVCAMLFLPQAYAEVKYLSEPVAPLFFKSLTQQAVAVKVMKVIDSLTFMGEDKNIYALSGIEIPNLQTGKSDFTLQASKTLALLIEGKDLKLYVTKNKDKGRLNRMNQSLVQAELRQDHIWIEGELLAAGLARVRTTVSNPDMVADMLKIEAEARAAGRGLWADQNLQVMTPDNVVGRENQFGIVEGTPKAAAVTRNMVFLNYGSDYRKDFTVGIPTSLRTAFARKGIDPLKLAQTKLRVRGWIQSYNGPFIEIDHPEQIELLGAIPIFASSLPAEEPPPNRAGMRSINLPKAPAIDKPTVATPSAPVANAPKKNAAFPNP